MNTTELVVEIRPEKNSGPHGIWTYDLCDTGAALYQLSQQATGSWSLCWISYIGFMGSNPVRAWFFFRSYFNYKFSSVRSCEDRLYSFWNALWMYIRTQ